MTNLIDNFLRDNDDMILIGRAGAGCEIYDGYGNIHTNDFDDIMYLMQQFNPDTNTHIDFVWVNAKGTICT